MKNFFSFLLIINCIHLFAGPDDVAAFNAQSMHVLVAVQTVNDEIHRTGCVKDSLPELQDSLHALLDVWHRLLPAERDTLAGCADVTSNAVLICFQLIAQYESASVSAGHPELFDLILQFIQEDFREVVRAIDTNFEEGVDLKDDREMLLFVESSVRSRTDISSAEKKVVTNLVQSYLQQISREAQAGAKLFCFSDGGDECTQVRRRSGRRGALAPGGVVPCADAMETLHLEDDGRGEIDSLPRDPDALLVYINEHFLTAESLMRMKEEMGGAAGSSRDESIDVLPLLDDLARVLVRADLLLGRADGADQLEVFRRRLADLRRQC